jgi:xanthosine utilization system XapX-like protein
MAQSGVGGLIAVAISGIIGIYIVIQFVPLVENAGAVVVVLTGLFGILIAYSVIRVFL